MWKKLSSKLILNHNRLKVMEDKVELPSGKKVNYLRFGISGNGVTIIGVRSDGKILLQKEYSYPPNEVLLQFPGGFVPIGEDLKEGANRELMEEAGLKANTIIPIGSYYVNNRRSEEKMHVFKALDLIAESRKGDTEEDIESLWFSESEIDKLIKDSKIINFTVLSAWCLFKLKTK